MDSHPDAFTCYRHSDLCVLRNPNIISSQQNPTGVWTATILASIIWPMWEHGPLRTPQPMATTHHSRWYLLLRGEIDGAGSFNGVSSYLEIPATAFPNVPTGVYNSIGVNTAWNDTSFDATFASGSRPLCGVVCSIRPR